MSNIAHAGGFGEPGHLWRLGAATPAREAYDILHVAFVIAPILAGLDKFAGVLTNWDKYLCPLVSDLVGGRVHGFMMVVGAIEIVAGIGVALWPRVFSYVVALWLVGIMVNLLLTGGYYDIVLRDMGLCLGALALGRLSQEYGHKAAM